MVVGSELKRVTRHLFASQYGTLSWSRHGILWALTSELSWVDRFLLPVIDVSYTNDAEIFFCISHPVLGG